MPATWRDDLPVKVANVLVFIFLFGSSIWSSTSGGLSHGKDTYLTPAAYVQWVWTVIHALLFGFIIFQFTPEGHEAVVSAIGWRFVLLAILNAIYVHLYAHGHYVVGFIFALLTAAVVSHVFYSLKFVVSRKGVLDTLFVHLPFSLWHAWSFFLAVHSLFVAFGRSHHSHAGIGTQIAVVIALAFLTTTAWGYTFADDDRGDVAGAAVLAYVLYGIWDHSSKHPRSIHYAAIVAFVLVLLAIVKVFANGYRKHGRGAVSLGDEERGPLLTSN